VAVTWGEDFKMASIGCLQVSEQSHSAKCESTSQSKMIVSTVKGCPQAFSNLVTNKKN